MAVAAAAADLPPLLFPSLRGRRILVTGGAGYIGSHTVLTLLQASARVTVVDNLINASRESLARVERLAKEAASTQGAAPPEPIEFHEVDLRHFDALERVFAGALAAGSSFDACIHFAGLKAVGESVRKPLAYYEHNVVGTLNLLKLLEKFGCRNLVFSSSATVYGLAECNPIPETAPLSTTNPYGQTKLVIEEILRDLARAPVVPPQQGVRAMVSADAALGSPAGPWRIVLLRYFNPIGAHPSGLIGEDPLGIPNNLLPFVMQVAVGRREKVAVFAEPPFDTPDGTGVRDYIHVMDLAEGHLAALEQGVFGSALQQSGDGAAQGSSACDVFNLGTGAGVSVLDMLSAARRASGRAIAHEIVPRRPGDIATCYADASKAKQRLHFHTRRSLDQGVADSWRWQSQNPNGYAAAAAPAAGEQK